jgi:hypothetical protein
LGILLMLDQVAFFVQKSERGGLRGSVGIGQRRFRIPVEGVRVVVVAIIAVADELDLMGVFRVFEYVERGDGLRVFGKIALRFYEFGKLRPLDGKRSEVREFRIGVAWGRR